VIVELGDGVQGFAVGDEVLGFSEQRSSQAEFVAVPPRRSPQAARRSVAGGGPACSSRLHRVRGVRSVHLTAGDVVAVSAAAGGVGTYRRPARQAFRCNRSRHCRSIERRLLSTHGVIPVNYGTPVDFADLANRLRAASPSGRSTRFLDFFGGGYVEMAIDRLAFRPTGSTRSSISPPRTDSA